jgi:CRP-like cAMP-binding protein
MVAGHLKAEFQVPKGELIFRQGDPGDEMFVVERGKIRLTIGSEGHEKEVMVAGPGQFFGELSLLGNAPRSATATAVEDSVLLAIGRDVFNMMVQDDLSIVYRMMSIQGQRLSRTNQPIEQLTHRMGEVRVITHMLRELRQTTSFPAVLEGAALVAAVGLSKDAVEATLVDLAKRGLGQVNNGQFVIRDAAQRDRLLDAACELTSF